MNQCPKCNTPLRDFRFIIGGVVEEVPQCCPSCNADRLNRMQEMSDSALIQFMAKLGVPSRYINATLTTAMYDQSSLDFTKGTLWYGESGVGKTYQMVGMMKEAILNEYKVKFVDWSAVMCSLRCKPETYSSILDDMLNHGLIAIDDFYVDNNYTYDYVYHIIKALHGRDKRILMTATELPAQPKIAMRLAEMTNQYEVVNEWK